MRVRGEARGFYPAMLWAWSVTIIKCLVNLLVSARRRHVASVAGLWFTDGLFLFRSRSQPLLIRAPNVLPTHVSWLKVVNARLEFRISLLIISQRAKNRKKAFFTCFSLGDLTFSITAQKRFGLLENRKRMIHLRWFTFHTFSLITVVLVVLQITAHSNINQISKRCVQH